jgi:hypothetical protein
LLVAEGTVMGQHLENNNPPSLGATESNLLTLLDLPGEPEPRRSVRATKGQHTKPFDQLDQPADAPKRRQGKRGKKATPTADEKQDDQQSEDEVIRCVCGATEQDEDSGEPWIACDTCGAWQHNVCVGMSVFTEDVPNNYYCEQCEPTMHKELLEGIEKGEKPWEARRAAYEAEAEKKKRRGRKGGRGKRLSDQKDKDATPPVSGRTPPASDPNKEKKDPGKQTGKRKTRDDSRDTESQVRNRFPLLVVGKSHVRHLQFTVV